MKRNEIKIDPGYYEKYISLVDNIELSEAFNHSYQELSSLDVSALEKLGDQTYAPGKWTSKDILQHIIDSERILSYRALRFSRNDKTPTEGFDQEIYALEAKAVRRSLTSLLDELKSLRKSTIAMFTSFDDDQLDLTGISWQYEMSVLAMGFTIIGHQIHHFNILKEKYLPLLLNNVSYE